MSDVNESVVIDEPQPEENQEKKNKFWHKGAPSDEHEMRYGLWKKKPKNKLEYEKQEKLKDTKP